MQRQINPPPPPRSILTDMTPQQIEAWLTEQGYNGQDRARKAASIILYRHYRGSPSVNLFCAPSGSGKTFLWTLLQKADPSIYVFDASILTPQGFRGTKLESCFRSIHPEVRSHSIIVFDEFEKALYKNDSSYPISDMLQSEMLRCFNRDRAFFAGESGNDFTEINFSGVSFILLGAFGNLVKTKSRSETSVGFGGTPKHKLTYDDIDLSIEDIVKHTPLKEELGGRIDRVVSMKRLTPQEIFLILLDYVDDTATTLRKEITIDHGTLFKIAQQATIRDFGARWAKSQVNQIIDNLLYEDCTKLALTYKAKELVYEQ